MIDRRRICIDCHQSQQEKQLGIARHYEWVFERDVLKRVVSICWGDEKVVERRLGWTYIPMHTI